MFLRFEVSYGSGQFEIFEDVSSAVAFLIGFAPGSFDDVYVEAVYAGQVWAAYGGTANEVAGDMIADWGPI